MPKFVIHANCNNWRCTIHETKKKKYRKSLTILQSKVLFHFSHCHTQIRKLCNGISGMHLIYTTSITILWNPNESHSVYPEVQHSIGLFNLQICLFDTHHIGLKSMYALSQTHIFLFLVRWPSALGMCLTSHTWSKEPTMSISVNVENTMHTWNQHWQPLNWV